MTHKLLLFCFGIVLFALITAGKDGGETVLKSSGSHISSTGAPGDQTCAQAGCHVDATLVHDSNNTVATLTLGAGDKSYKPNTLHTLTLKAIKADIKRFGFQIVALDTNNRSIGTFAVPQGNNKVQLQKGAINGSDRFYVTHTTPGNKPAVTGEIEWKFNWTASQKYQGKVTFHYCVNACDMDNTNAGDQLYLNAVPFNATVTGVEENISGAINYHCYPTIASEYLTVENLNGFPLSTKYSVVSLQGATLMQGLLGERNTSAQIPLEILPNGFYTLHIVTGSSTIAKQFIVRK